MPKRGIIGRLWVAVLAALLALTSGQALAADEDEFVIGTLWPLSGVAATWGVDNLEAAKIAVEIVNERGGINGKPVRLINADNGSDPTTAVNEANRLISQHGVKIIVGTVVSSAAVPASEVADQNKVIYIEADAVTDEVTTRGLRYVFRVNETASQHGEAAVEFIKNVIAPKLGVDYRSLRVAVAHEDSAYGTSVSDAAERALRAEGMNYIGTESYNRLATDLSSVILKLRARRPDVIIHTGYTPDIMLFWKTARQLNLDVKALVGGAGWTLEATGEGLGDLVEGVFDASGPTNVNTANMPDHVKELHAEFMRRWNEKFSRRPSLSSFQGFTAMWMLVNDVLPRAGSTDPEKVREALLSLDIPVLGTIIGWGVKFDETGQNTRAFATVMQWQNGEVVVVYPTELATAEPIMIPLPKWSER